VVSRWYYQRNGHTFGPFSVDQVQARATAGDLQPEDLLWPEGADRGEAVPARAAVHFSAPERPAPSLPAWLDDVRQAAQGEVLPTPPRSQGLPDWLQDVEGAASTPNPARGQPPRDARAGATAAPERVEGLGRPEPQPLREVTSRPPSLVELTASRPAGDPPLATPVENSEEAAARLLLSGPLPTVAPGHTLAPVPLATPGTGKPGLNPPRPAQPPREEQRRRPEEPTAPSTATLPEIFRRAKREIQDWVDQDQNRAVVIRGDREAMWRDAGLQDVLRRYQRYGPEVADKLLRYLEFLVENRRQYYSAISRPT
jgi:hypothetical protein